MRKFYFFASAILAMLATSCSDEETIIEIVEVDVVTFEGNTAETSEYIYAYSSWSDATTDLCGESVTGTDSYVDGDGATQYYSYWSYGTVVSNFTKDAAYGVDYNYQLSVVGDEEGNGGANGSENFLIVYTSDYAPAALWFGGEAKSIYSLYVANTSYMISSCTYGDSYLETYGYEGGMGSSDWATVIFTGYDADDNEAGTVEVYLAKNGKVVEGWNKVSLASLGAVSKVEITTNSSVQNDWGNILPGYVAIDNVAILVE